MINHPATCGVCGSKTRLSLKSIHGKYRLYECQSCKVQFWDPLKNPGSEWYEKDDRYASRNNNPPARQERNHREFLKDHPHRQGKILDVGMGTGNFLRVAKLVGYDCYGIDFDRDAIAVAQKKFGLTNTYPIPPEGVLEKFGPEFFVVVTMFEVLEHLENPEKILRLAHDLLAKKGFVVISVPHRNCPEYLKPHDLPPRHLTRWNESALVTILNRAGFEVCRLQPIRIPLSYIITKFHFWAMGVASFNLTQKLSPASGFTQKDSSKLALRKIIPIIARLKDYLLFGLPATILWVYCLFRGYCLGLYVLAKRKN